MPRKGTAMTDKKNLSDEQLKKVTGGDAAEDLIEKATTGAAQAAVRQFGEPQSADAEGYPHSNTIPSGQ